MTMQEGSEILGSFADFAKHIIKIKIYHAAVNIGVIDRLKHYEVAINTGIFRFFPRQVPVVLSIFLWKDKVALLKSVRQQATQETGWWGWWL